jgi:hypothetical protein
MRRFNERRPRTEARSVILAHPSEPVAEKIKSSHLRMLITEAYPKGTALRANTLASGMQPFARLLEANGKVYRQAPAFIAEIKAALASDDASRASATVRAGQGAPDLSPLRAPTDFHRDPRYGGDLHRADLAWARHAADMGLSASEIRTALMEARDLAKKGSPSRQREYAERTASKALRQTD